MAKGGGAASPLGWCLGQNRFGGVEWVPCCCRRLLGMTGLRLFLCGTPGSSLLACFVGVGNSTHEQKLIRCKKGFFIIIALFRDVVDCRIYVLLNGSLIDSETVCCGDNMYRGC